MSNKAAGFGGGTQGSTVYASTLLGNIASPGGVFGAGGGGARSGSLDGCKIIGNSTPSLGGGVKDASVTRCLLISNSGYNGGAAMGGFLRDCLVVSNVANNVGGGAYSSYLTNCTLARNSAFIGGGVRAATLQNSIVYSNSAPTDTNYSTDCVLNYCCSEPLPSGLGNVVGDPLFIDVFAGNFRLQSGSPCLDIGDNTAVDIAGDLDGRPRIFGSTVDIGAYEYQGPGTGEFFGWLEQFGLRTDGSQDFTDTDSDGMNNWQEWRCLTNPTNALSVFKLLAPTSGVSGVNVTWQSVADRSYWLERATNLGTSPSFSVVATNLLGQVGTKTYLDTTAVGLGPFLYRVGVQP